jgi:hypothetical protein
VSGRQFHFALEFSNEALPDAVVGDVVKSILRHAGLSSADAAEAAGQVLDASRRAAGPCRVQFDGGVEQVEIVVEHGATESWRGVRAVE